ncbi:MAG: hypothetical protein E4H09_02475, partial [Spirochaetales bacterium]
MKDEREMILKMLSEGKITVEEADALLDVLNETSDKAEPAGFTPSNSSSAASTGSHQHAHSRGEENRESSDSDHGFRFDVDMSGLKNSLREAMGSVRETMKDVGKTIQDAFEGVDMSEVGAGIFRTMGKIRAEETRKLSSPVGDATSVSVVNNWGDVRVNGTDDDEISVTAEVPAWGATEEAAQEALRQVELDLRREEDRWILDITSPEPKG